MLRMLRHMRPSLPRFHVRLLCNALVISCVDYCSSLLASLGKADQEKIQRVVKFAARVISGCKRYDHITPILRELSWPTSIEQRIKIKLSVLVFKALHGLLPTHLATDIQQYEPKRTLRSSSSNSTLLVLGSARTKCGRGDWRVAAPSTWNSLPDEVRERDIKYPQFVAKLKLQVLNEDG